MSHRLVPAVLAAALLAGCGTAGLAPTAGPRAAAGVQAAGLTGTQALAAFEKKPSLGLTKRPQPIRIDPIAGEPTPPGPVPESIAKIQGLAATGLTEAEKKESWNDRWGVTDQALQKIDAVKLATSGVNNVPAKVGMLAARGYGYIGMHPTHENRYKIQTVTLNYLRGTAQEASLAKGSPLFTMSADMLEITTGWDQGFRVGLSVLTAMKENYKDKAISKACQALIDKSCAAPSKEEAYGTMVAGLRDLAKKVAK